jgi:hypothetical protein
VRDRDLNAITNHFFNQTQTVTPGQQTDDPLPTPEPPEGPGDDPVPVPGPTPDPEDGDSPPTPGGGVPPGLREPSDPDPGSEDPGDVGDPGDTPEPGVGDEPGSDPGTGTPDDGDDGDGEPVDPVTPEDGTEEGSDKGGASPGGAVEPGGRDGGGEGGGSDGDTGPKPEEVEPPPDGSGEGEPEEPDEAPAPDGQVPPDLRDPEDPNLPTNTVGDGTDAWDATIEPSGPETARVLSQFRGVLNTFDRDHQAGGGAEDRNSRFMPCFRVWEQHSGVLNHRVGRNDVITISYGGEDGSAPERIDAIVRWGDETSNWMALEDFVDTRVKAPEEGANVLRLDLRGRPRILKVPCGELPDELPTDMEFGRSTVSNSDVVTAFLDELHIWRHPIGPKAIVIDNEGVEATGSEITLYAQRPAETLEDTPGWDPDCGVFLLNGELIVYRGTSIQSDGRVMLERCMRGMFKTRAKYHAPGSYGRFLPSIPVSYLNGNLPKDSASIPLAHTRGWPREGLVRILGQGAGELVHYTRRTEDSLLIPEALDAQDEYARGTGLLRGRFGTDAIDHDSDEVVIFTPSRYWDRYTPRPTDDEGAFAGVYDHAESAYVELGLRRNNAYWHSLRWEENLDGMRHGEDLRGAERGSSTESGLLDILVLARFSKNVPWDSDNIIDMRTGASMASTRRAHSVDALYLFDDPEAMNDLGFEANTAQVRVFFRYKPNAYVFLDLPGESTDSFDEVVLTNEWKKTPWLQSLSISYTNRTRTLSSAKAGKGR